MEIFLLNNSIFTFKTFIKVLNMGFLIDDFNQKYSDLTCFIKNLIFKTFTFIINQTMYFNNEIYFQKLCLFQMRMFNKSISNRCFEIIFEFREKFLNFTGQNTLSESPSSRLLTTKFCLIYLKIPVILFTFQKIFESFHALSCIKKYIFKHDINNLCYIKNVRCFQLIKLCSLRKIRLYILFQCKCLYYF